MPVFTDTGGSANWTCSGIDEVPTITRSHASSLWCSMKGAYLDAVDLCYLQGVAGSCPVWREIMHESEFAKALGNAMSANVLDHIFPWP